MAWRDEARRAMRTLAATGEPFTADDLIVMVGHPDQLHVENGANSAIGAAFREAHRARLIKVAGVRASKQPQRKGGMVRVWKGTLEQPELLTD